MILSFNNEKRDIEQHKTCHFNMTSDVHYVLKEIVCLASIFHSIIRNLQFFSEKK